MSIPSAVLCTDMYDVLLNLKARLLFINWFPKHQYTCTIPGVWAGSAFGDWVPNCHANVYYAIYLSTKNFQRIKINDNILPSYKRDGIQRLSSKPRVHEQQSCQIRCWLRKKMAAKVLLSNRGAHGIFTAAVIPLWLPANTLTKSFTTALALEAANTHCKKNYNNEELQEYVNVG